MKFWNSKVGEDVEALAQAIEDTPKDWTQGQYNFTNNRNPSISIWTGNGTSHLHLEGHDEASMNRKEKKRVLKAIHVCLRKQIALVAKEIKND